MGRIIAVLVFGGLIAAGYYGYRSYAKSAPDVHFRTAQVEMGDLIVSVSATGTLEPEDLVDVGAQLVGRVTELGVEADASGAGTGQPKRIDYGSVVEKDQLLARIDDSIYRAQFNQAKAAVLNAEANLLQTQARLMQTEAEWDRAKKLRSLKLTGLSPSALRSTKREPFEIKGIADADYVLAQSNFESAKASVEVAKAIIEQNRATLELAETNLGYTVIRSPVSGTIIDRRVNIGQTVISSLSAPSLFLIAKDLRRMQVWASVNEADIGVLKIGMPVTFTVDAFPEDLFHGTVAQIRLNATMTQNVVTYTVVIANDNADLKLLPYLTANVKFLVKQLPQVLLVPNAALRYQPVPERMVPDALDQAGTASGSDAANGPAPNGKPGTVWIRDGDFVRPVTVMMGESDDTSTEILAGEIEVGDEVVLGETKEAVAQDVTNPFAPPRMPRRTPTPRSTRSGAGFQPVRKVA